MPEAKTNHTVKTSTMAENRKTAALDEQVARNLRRIYQETADEPVPGRLLELLEKLRAQDQEEPKDDSDSQDGNAE
jgi:hypothetical protein